MEHGTAAVALQTFLAQADAQFHHLAQELGHWVLTSPRTLAEIEQHTLATVKEVGQQMLAGVCQGAAAGAPTPPTTRCACGHQAAYQRQRSAQVRTVLGPISIQRAYYHCTACHQGLAPLDRHLGYCAGSTSAGLDEVLALLGATADSFASASALLEKLTLVHICPNVVRAVTETLGQVLQAEEQAVVQAAWAQGTVPPASATPTQLYISMDGVLVHTEAQWREYKLGSVYTTTTRPSTTHPGRDDVCAQEISYVGDVAEAADFGQLLWCEAARRGVCTAQEVVVLADGAHWIWHLADEHFPEATQIVDWYHASHYVWQAAHAIYGEGTPLAKRWATRRLAELWAGQVPKVLRALGKAPQRAAVQEASTYYTYHQQRMCYADYRARGLQIGSGTMESGCKQIATARLKQAGMIWSLAGVRAVAAVRTWLKSDRWAEAMTLRPLRQRTYQRLAA
jgi:hypothetical protein